MRIRLTQASDVYINLPDIQDVSSLECYGYIQLVGGRNKFEGRGQLKMDNGRQSVTEDGMIRKQESCANDWDLLKIYKN